ncbi:MAG TPA: hypothetical protein PKL56_16115 [Cyclobacteriaceae bacterium]|nr:hypothetical protein [Cyclobacteriaceae bacterium]HMX88062.1 hypothetical protein [Saprospiraceae bacterium]HMX00895.1 hypothetical protein [Cyclobacteriaceae bacterium]HMY93699.1 hypothetical protein [Cyclobacteriaceae bacterium]HNA12867.1 hypothetical protein [Cyclobacteriaceae bacterium]
MNIIKDIRDFLYSLFFRKKRSKKSIISEQEVHVGGVVFLKRLSKAGGDEGSLFDLYEDGPKLLVDKESYESVRLVSTYQPFKPNLGDLDPSVSLISNGRKSLDVFNYKHDDFQRRYSHLTTDLGFGIIYSIIKDAVEVDNRSLKSGLREAIARSGDPLLCVEVARDYCKHNYIHFEKYERITDEILRKRATYYRTDTTGSIDFDSLPPLNEEEKQDLDRSSWLFNGSIVKVEKLFLVVKIPSLKSSQVIRDFNKNRYWKADQNVVVQCDDQNNFRILDFK